jgi:predicted DNA-binding WGR domain protein
MTVYNDGTTTWDMKLTYINPAENSDKFYDARIFVDSAGTYTLEKRWGRTGTTGQKQLDPRLSFDEAKKGFEKIVAEKKAKGYEEVVQDRSIQRQQSTKWQYYLTNDPHHKPDGWYDYAGSVLTEDSAMSNMERYWEEWKSNPRLETRFVQSGFFTYKVSFGDMTQTNTTSKKTRPIQRV